MYSFNFKFDSPLDLKYPSWNSNLGSITISRSEAELELLKQEAETINQKIRELENSNG